MQGGGQNRGLELVFINFLAESRSPRLARPLRDDNDVKPPLCLITELRVIRPVQRRARVESSFKRR